MWLAWIGAGALWLLLGFKLDPDAASGSEQAGYVVGGYAFTLAAAAVIRGVYYFVRRREVRFWSPWLLVIAAGFGFLGKVSDIGEAAQRSQDVARVEARVPGEESKAVKECIGGGVQRYGEAMPEQRSFCRGTTGRS